MELNIVTEKKVREYHQGLAAVCIEHYHLNEEGKKCIVIDEDPAKGTPGPLCGFIDEQGNEVIPPKYLAVSDFENGYAMVKKLIRRNGCNIGVLGMIDMQGNEVIPCMYKRLTRFSPQGLAIFRRGDSLGFINTRGEEIIVIENASDLRHFSDGLAAVRHYSHRFWGFINPTGKWVIPDKKYDEVDDFVDGYAVVGRDVGRYNKYMKYGVIDKKGVEVVPLKYSKNNAVKKLEEYNRLIGNKTSSKCDLDTKFRTVATLRSGSEIVGLVLYHEATNQAKEIQLEEAIKKLQSNGSINITWDETKNKLIGTECSIDRLPSIDINTHKVSNNLPIIVSRVKSNKGDGFKVVNYLGKVTIMSEKELLEVANKVGIANAKVVNKGGNKQYISAIKGEFKVVNL